MSIYAKEFKDSIVSGCRSYAIYSGSMCEFLSYEACVIRGDRIREYAKGHPYPEGEDQYILEDLIGDFEHAGGSITFLCRLEETADWISDMVGALL